MDHAKCHPAPTSVPRLRRVLLGSLLSSIIQVKKTYLAKGSPIEYMSNSKSHELFTNPLDFCHAFLIHYESSCLLSLSRVVVGACGFPPLLFTFKCTTTTSCVPLVTTKHCCTFVLEAILSVLSGGGLTHLDVASSGAGVSAAFSLTAWTCAVFLSCEDEFKEQVVEVFCCLLGCKL